MDASSPEFPAGAAVTAGRVAELARLVLRDLARGGGDVPRVEVSPPVDGLLEVLVTDADGTAVGFGVDPLAGDVGVLLQLADRLPDAWVDFHWAGAPLVPGAPRPAQPRTVADRVLWTDPAPGGTWSCAVGEYEPGPSH